MADLTAALGKPQLTSASGRWLLWDIRPWAERTGLTNAEARAAARRLVGDASTGAREAAQTSPNPRPTAWVEVASAISQGNARHDPHLVEVRSSEACSRRA